MNKSWREFYDVDAAAKLLSLSLDDLWHLIEIEKIGASFRRVLADSKIHINNDITIEDYLASAFTFLIKGKDASLIVARGSCLLTEARLQLENPRETIDVNGEPFYFFDSELFKLDTPLEITKDDIVITQRSIDKYYNNVFFNKAKVADLDSKPITERERETLLVIIAALAKEANINIEKTSKAGYLIANMTQLLGAPIGATTIETHLKKINQAIANRAK